MGKILNLIEGNMNGDAWEDLCVRCYRMKYQEQHYVAIPAVHKGDAGIEGYGFVSQQRNGNYKLTTKGHNLAERIKIVGDLMTSELTSLGDLSKKLTEGKIKELADLWRTNNASN